MTATCVRWEQETTMDWKGRLGRKLKWRVDQDATTADLMADPAPPPAGGGRVVFVDENGRPRRLPADLGELSPEQRDAAIDAMAQALGGATPDAARVAAIERLTELRAAGKMSEEQFQKERRRLESY
ncbi:MAG: hypothetical protein KY463_07650 [Actinobacteria bacterium]|nr:hypothetical protein [Actinomycetota bacterium]